MKIYGRSNQSQRTTEREKKLNQREYLKILISKTELHDDDKQK